MQVNSISLASNFTSGVGAYTGIVKPSKHLLCATVYLQIFVLELWTPWELAQDNTVDMCTCRTKYYRLPSPAPLSPTATPPTTTPTQPHPHRYWPYSTLILFQWPWTCQSHWSSHSPRSPPARFWPPDHGEQTSLAPGIPFPMIVWWWSCTNGWGWRR